VPGDEGADPLRAVSLVSAEAHEVDAKGGEVDSELAQRLDGVAVDKDARVAGARRLDDGADVLDGAHLVVGEHHGEEDGVRPDGGGHLLRVDPAKAVAADRRDLGSTGLVQRLDSGQDGLVLDGRDHQVAPSFSAPAFEDPPDGEVVSLRAAPGEDDLPRGALDRRGDTVARCIDGRASAPAEPVDRRRVAESLPEPREHRRPNRRVQGRGGRVVQVDDSG
jgi:hypothetical protein